MLSVANPVKFGVVILNYLAYQVTIDCIECFLKLDQTNKFMKIIVVDNHSPNDSYEILRKKYDANSQVEIVQTDENLGFARGNNYGYQILKKEMEPDFVIFSNDDILLKDQKLLSWIENMYIKYEFAVLGPKIYSKYGKYYQSPLENFSQNKNECRKKLFEYRLILAQLKVKRILHKKSKSLAEKKYKDAEYQTMTTKKTLHGSFLIMSKKYLNEFSEPFDSNTYLYMEENLLKLRCDTKSLTMLYSPDYEIIHLQAIATNMVVSDQTQRDYKRIKNIIASLKYYISILK